MLNRERRLWLWAIVVTVVIFTAADLARAVSEALHRSGLPASGPNLFSVGMLLIGIMILVQGLRGRPRGIEIGFAVGLVAITVLGLARGLSEAERSHLIEYAVLALIVYEALVERRRRGRPVPVPAVLAIGGTTLVGALDECIQILLPNRTFDWFDIGFDFLASVLAVGSSVGLGLICRLFSAAAQAGAAALEGAAVPWLPGFLKRVSKLLKRGG